MTNEVKFNWSLDDDGFDVAEINHDELSGPVVGMIDFSQVEDTEGTYGLWVTVTDPGTGEDVDYYANSNEFEGNFDNKEDILAHHAKVKQGLEDIIKKVIDTGDTSVLVNAGYEAQQSTEVVEVYNY